MLEEADRALGEPLLVGSSTVMSSPLAPHCIGTVASLLGKLVRRWMWKAVMLELSVEELSWLMLFSSSELSSLSCFQNWVDLFK